MSRITVRRSNGEDHEITSTLAGVIPPQWTYTPETMVVSSPSFETFKQITSDSQNGRLEWHSFLNYKKEASPGDSLPIVSESIPEWNYYGANGKEYRWGSHWEFPIRPGTCSFGPLDQPDFGLPSLYSVNEGELFIAPPDNLDHLLDLAVRQMIPGIRPELSLLNTLHELKDLKSLARTASYMKDTFLRIANIKDRKGLTVSQKYGKLTMKELNRRASSGYLEYKFNLAPLLSDIKGFIKSLKNYQKQVKNLLSQTDRVRRRHFTIEVAPGLSQFEEGDSQYSAFDVAKSPHIPYYIYTRHHRQVELEPVKLHVEIEYQYSLSDFERLHADTLGLLDSLGINLDPQIIWNAIPWSFVVDWVVDVGPYLGRFKIPGLQPVINIRRSCWSIKRTRHIRMTVDVNKQQSLPSSRVTETAYRRSIFTPTMTSLQAGGLSPTEVSLGYALVSTRGRGLKH